MDSVHEESFRQVWPKFLVILLAIIEFLAVIALCLSELGNVAANFWTTNVFAGGWCGLIVLVHMFFLFVAGCCSPSLSTAFRAAIISVVAIIACLVLIAFDAYFIAAPTTCLLTSSCYENSGSNTTFNYNFQKSFFDVFNSWSPFKSYSPSYTKFFFQTIQLCVGGLCFLLCIVYLVIYYLSKSKSEKQAATGSQFPQDDYSVPQENGPRRLPNNYLFAMPTGPSEPSYLNQPQPPTLKASWNLQN